MLLIMQYPTCSISTIAQLWGSRCCPLLCCALLSCSDMERQLQNKDQLIQDAERRVADKQRAYNLLYADFAKQKAEAAEAVEAAVQLQQK